MNKTEHVELVHNCFLIPFGDEEKRCIKCGYITWNVNKSNNEIITDMIRAGYEMPTCTKKVITFIENN